MGDNIESRLKDVGSTLKNGGEELLNTITGIMKKNPEEQLVEIIILAMIGLVVVIFVFWAYSLTTLEYRDCENLDKIYGSRNNHVRPIAVRSNDGYKYETNIELFKSDGGGGRIFSYYVKTAYNCCSPGNFNNSFVSICALKNAIALGARCLDFEIYSVDTEPVISTSTQSDSLSSSFYIKETFNTIKLTDVLYYIKYFALESSNPGEGSTNYTDPLFLHFRIMTLQDKTINLVAKYLQEILGDHLLGSQYGNNYRNASMNRLPLIDFCGKCIIMVNNNNNTIYSEAIRTSDLWTLTNIFIGGDSLYNKSLKYSDIKSMSNDKSLELQNFNKYGVSIVLPDNNSEAINFDPRKCLRNGCQFVAMNFQTFDSNLETYFSIFDELQYSFILKPCRLRWTPVHYMIAQTDLDVGAGCSRTVTANNGSVVVAGQQSPATDQSSDN